jgi:membrane-bound toxin of toxin-antitoxin system
LSTRYSTSPSLRLRIADSTLRRVLYVGLCLCVAYCLCRLHLKGYSLLALSLLPVAGLGCWRLAFEPMSGAILCWRRGQWLIERGSSSVPIAIHRGSCCLPWLIYLAWTELPTGRKCRLWLFADSAGAGELRRLRVRLKLER